MRLRTSGWPVRGPGFHPGLCLRSFAEAVQPEGGRSERRASPFSNSCCYFLWTRAQLSLSPGLQPAHWSPGRAEARHWALRLDLAPGGGAGEAPSRGPLLLPLRPVWPSTLHFSALRQHHLSQDMPSSLSTTTLGPDVGDKVDEDGDLGWAPGRWARVWERD